MAIILGQILSFLLIITFIFANHEYGLIGALSASPLPMSMQAARTAACLIGIVGAASVWITWYYLSKSNTMRDMLVVCAWTRKVKTNGKWIKFEDFLTQELGYAVSHGLSDSKLVELRQEVDRDWRKLPVETKVEDKGTAKDDPTDNGTARALS